MSERLARLEPLRGRPRTDFDADPYLRDITERNLEIAAQCVIDICHRIISIEGARKPADYHGAILEMGDLNVLPVDFARELAPLAGFRNVLVHEYVGIDWEEVHSNLQRLEDLRRFGDLVRAWLRDRGESREK